MLCYTASNNSTFIGMIKNSITFLLQASMKNCWTCTV